MARFLTVKMRCPNCGADWKARVCVKREEGELYFQHLDLENCLLCGAEGSVTDEGTEKLADALDSEETSGADPFAA